MFTRIFIDNYRCFVNFEFRPARVNLLLGTNGSGKSTFLKLLHDVVNLIVRGADVWSVFEKSTLTRWDKRLQQRFEFDLKTEVGVFHYILVVENEQISKERVALADKILFEYADGKLALYSNDGQLKTQLGFRGTRSFLSEIDRGPANFGLASFLEALETLVTLKLDVNGARNHLSEREQRRLLVDGSNYSSWYRYLNEESPLVAQSLQNNLREILAGFQHMRFVASGLKEKELVLVFKTAGAQYEVAYHELSDGQKCLLVLYTLLHALPTDGMVLLDEPEIHVGLAEVQPWLVELDDKLGMTGQIFLSSNHPTVVDFMAASTPVLFERVEGGPVRCKVAEFFIDDGLKASEQIIRGYLG